MCDKKKCGTCNIEYPKTKEYFGTRSDRGKLEYQSKCKECQKKYRRDHYLKNKDKYIEKSKDWKLKQKLKILKYLSNKSCADCGEDNPIVLEFDHLSDKEFDIGSKIGHYSYDKILKEINKCDVVCANCHRIRTATRSNSYRYLYKD